MLIFYVRLLPLQGTDSENLKKQVWDIHGLELEFASPKDQRKFKSLIALVG